MKFYDLGIKTSLSTGQNTPEEMLKFAIDLGYSGIAFADFETVPPKAIKKLRKEYSEQCKIFTRATIIPNSLNDMKKKLKDLQNSVDFIAVRSGSDEKNTYVNAIIDKRVDIISLSELIEFECLDYSHFKMAKDNGTVIEISLRNLILKEKFLRSKLMRLMNRNCTQLLRAEAPFILSSGAESKWELRAPRELLALAGLIKINENQGIRALSKYPQALTEKVKMIRDPNQIMAGVRIISPEEGDDGE